MKVINARYKHCYCNECHKRDLGKFFDIQIGEFVSSICPECMEKLRNLLDEKVREYMEEIDNV